MYLFIIGYVVGKLNIGLLIVEVIYFVFWCVVLFFDVYVCKFIYLKFL